MGYYSRGLAVRNDPFRVYRDGVRVGAFYHSVGDREDAIKQLNLDYNALQNELAPQMGWTQDHPVYDEASPLYQWYHLNALPSLNAWEVWRDGELGSWLERFGTSWDSIEAWRTRLVQLRDDAQRAGFKITTAAPAALPTTVFQDIGGGVSKIGAEIWSLIKILIYAGAIIGGIIIVSRLL